MFSRILFSTLAAVSLASATPALAGEPSAGDMGDNTCRAMQRCCGKEAAHHRMADSADAAKQSAASVRREVETKQAPEEHSPFEWNQASGG